MFNATGSVYAHTIEGTKWIIIKLFLCFSIFVEALVSGIIIECLYRHKLVSQALLRVLGSFSTGLVLAGGLVDVLPNAISMYARHSNNLKVIAAIVASTIAFLLILDKTITVIIETRKRKHRSDQVSNQTNLTENNQVISGHAHAGASLHAEKWYICIIVLLGLSMHSLFEGVALGAADNIPLLLNLYLMVVLHKGFVSASLVVVLISSGGRVRRMRLYSFVLFFSSMSAIGGCVGVAISQLASNIWPIDSLLDSVAAGTLVYVALKELVAEFLDQVEDRLWLDLSKIGMFVFGFVFIAVLNVCMPIH